MEQALEMACHHYLAKGPPSNFSLSLFFLLFFYFFYFFTPNPNKKGDITNFLKLDAQNLEFFFAFGSDCKSERKFKRVK
jgi:hypothetical protein